MSNVTRGLAGFSQYQSLDAAPWLILSIRELGRQVVRGVGEDGDDRRVVLLQQLLGALLPLVGNLATATVVGWLPERRDEVAILPSEVGGQRPPLVLRHQTIILAGAVVCTLGIEPTHEPTAFASDEQLTISSRQAAVAAERSQGCGFDPVSGP